jgi:hypothetical protein
MEFFMRLYFVVPVITLLFSCSSDNSNFRADCNGKIITYSQGIQTVDKEIRRYEFANNKLIGRECILNKGIIFCYSEVAESDSRSKDQLIFDKGNYTLTDIRTTIEADKSSGVRFVKTEIYQSNCPITIIPTKK